MFLGRFHPCPLSKHSLKPAGSSSSASATGILCAVRTRIPASASSPSRRKTKSCWSSNSASRCKRRVIEIPAGIVGDEEEHLANRWPGPPRRELLEETGYRAGKIEKLIATPTSAGLTSEFIHLFYATDLTREHEGGGVAGEDIIVHHVPLGNLREWLREQRKPQENHRLQDPRRPVDGGALKIPQREFPGISRGRGPR